MCKQKTNPALDDAFSKVALHIPNGILLASSDPVAFMGAIEERLQMYRRMVDFVLAAHRELPEACGTCSMRKTCTKDGEKCELLKLFDVADGIMEKLEEME